MNLSADDPKAVHYARAYGTPLCKAKSKNVRSAWSFVSCTGCRQADLQLSQHYAVDTSNRKARRAD